MRIRYKLTGLLLIFTLSVTIFFYLTGLKNQKKDFEIAAKDHIDNIETTFNNLIERDSKILFSTLEVIVQDPAIKEVYLENNREKLYEYGHPLFQRLKDKYGITHFYFIQPDGHVFLRMHNKSIYGDLVERYSFVRSREIKGPAWEIELGKTAFALRTVMPYYQAGNLIGYVELGEEIDHLLHILKGETDSDFGLFAEKIYLDRDDWRSTRSVAGFRDNWDDMDKHLIISATNAGELTEECFMENNLEKIEKGERTLLPLHRNKKFFMCGGFDLTDEQGRHIGAILSLANITGHVINVQNANNAILRIAIILFFVIFAAGLLISRSITRPILRLVEVAKAISKGDLDKRVHVSSGDEIGLLGNTFNEMIQKRKLAEEKLGNSRNELEIRVNTRTAELTAANKKLQHEITERRRIEDELLLNHKRLEAIKEIGVMATSTLNLKGVLRRILEGTLQATGAHIGMIFLMDKNTGDLSWGRRWR